MNFSIALEVLEAIVLRRIKVYFETDRENSFAVIAKALAEAQFSVNYHAISSEQDVKGLWENIRTNEPFINFLVTLTAEFRARYCGHEMSTDPKVQAQAWSALVGIVAAAIGCMRDSAKMSGVDQDYLTRGQNTEQWKTLLESNPWLLVLCLIEMSDTTQKIRLLNNVAPPPRRTPG